MTLDGLRELLKTVGIVYDEHVDLKHGDESDYYIDVKKAYGEPSILSPLCHILWQQIEEELKEKPTCVAASGYGGLPPAVILSTKHRLRLAMIRDEPKKHGKGGLIDGYVPTEKDRVLIVDDVTTTGGTLVRIDEILKPTGAEIIGYWVFVKRGEGDAAFSISHLFVAEDFL